MNGQRVASAQMLSLVPPQPQIETDFASRHHCAFWPPGNNPAPGSSRTRGPIQIQRESTTGSCRPATSLSQEDL
jgi:hypothetical protein